MICLVIYFNVLNGDFLLDDNYLIVKNQYIKHLRFIPHLFISNLFDSDFSYPEVYFYYRPLQVLSYALNYSIYKLNPIGFHFTNILIHSINAFLVFYLIHGLFNHYQLAFLSSLFFCVHPIHTETVSYIASSAELLVSLFTLLSLVFYFDYLNSRQNLKYLLSLVSFICAWLSREAGYVLFIPLFNLIVGLRSRLSKKQVWLHLFSFLGIIVIYLVLRLTILVPVQYLPYNFLSFPLEILNFLYILTEYIRLLIFPYQLHILRTIKPITSYWSVYAIAPLLFLISLIIILIVSIRQKRYILLFGITWFILGLFYLLRFMYKFMGRLTMEEHWVYLPSVGFFIVLAWLLLNIPIKRMGRSAAVFIIIISCILTVVNNLHWKDESDFYRYNLRFVDPGLNFILRFNFASALSQRGLYDKAIAELGSVFLFDPENWMAYIQLGDILQAMKKYPEAKEAYGQALRIDPFCWQANRKLKLLAQESGQPYIEEVDPTLSPLEAKIISHLKMGEFTQASEILRSELSISPTVQLYTLAGIVLSKMGRYRQSIEAFNAALKLDPKDLRALYNLFVVYQRMMQHQKADQIRKRIERIR